MAKNKNKSTAKPNINAAAIKAQPKGTVGTTTARPNQSAPRLLEQQRAAFALQQIQAAVNRLEEGKYKHSQVKSFCRRFPGMVQSNGFGQAVAFFYSKRNDYPAYGTVYTLVEEWLCQDGQVYAAFKDAADPKLLTAITQSDQNAYRQATAETQALMVWVKKFAEGLILKDEEND